MASKDREFEEEKNKLNKKIEETDSKLTEVKRRLRESGEKHEEYVRKEQ